MVVVEAVKDLGCTRVEPDGHRVQKAWVEGCRIQGKVVCLGSFEYSSQM